MLSIEKKLNYPVCMVNKTILTFNPSPQVCSFLRNIKNEYVSGEVKWTCEFINFCIEEIVEAGIKITKNILPVKLVICGPGDEYESKDEEIIFELSSEYISDLESHSGSKIILEKNKVVVEEGYRVIVIFNLES